MSNLNITLDNLKVTENERNTTIDTLKSEIAYLEDALVVWKEYQKNTVIDLNNIEDYINNIPKIVKDSVKNITIKTL